MTTDQTTPYAETAYRSNAIPKQDAAPPLREKGRVFVARLPWGSYQRVNPTEQQFNDQWYELYDYAGEIDYKKYWGLTNRRWSIFPDNRNLHDLYRFVRFIFRMITALFSFVRGGGIFIFSLFFIVSLFGAFSALYAGSFDGQSYLFWIPLLIGVSCSICTFFKLHDERKELKDYKKNNNWSEAHAFNRQDGQVYLRGTHYPFYEFDPLIEARANTQGAATHSLVVRHRYPHLSRDEHGNVPEYSLAISGADGVAGLYAHWDMLQRYMDVTQPLPDIPELEPFRAQDPATRAYDEAGLRARPPTYWRDVYAEMHRAEKQRAQQPLVKRLTDRAWWRDLLGFTGNTELARKREKHNEVVQATSWAGRPDLMELSVPNYRESRTPEPKDVNAFAHFLAKKPELVDRPPAQQAPDSSDEVSNEPPENDEPPRTS